MIGKPLTKCKTLGISEFMREPKPPARIIASIIIKILNKKKKKIKRGKKGLISKSITKR